MSRKDRLRQPQPRRWEHGTITMPPDMPTLCQLLNALAERFGGEFLWLEKAVVTAGILVSQQPQQQLMWVVLLRFPLGKLQPALAFVRGMNQAPEPATNGQDAAGAQALTMEGV